MSSQPAYVQKFLVIIGAMQSGKSYFSNELIKQYTAAGWGAIVYNLGRSTDFSNAKKVVAMSHADHLRLCSTKEEKQAYKDDPFLMYYYDPKAPQKLYEWQNINFAPPAGIKGQAIKFIGMDSISERLFFDIIYQYISNTLIIFDDIRAAFSHGLKEEFRLLFSRINHTGEQSPESQGRGKGVSIALILHSLSDLARVDGLLTYATHIVNFRTMRPPDLSILKNDELLKAHFSKSYTWLSTAPKYSHTVTDIMGDYTKAKTPEQPYFLL